MELKQYGDALKKYQELLSLHPNNTQYAIEYGKCCEYLKDIDKAQKYYNMVIDADPDYFVLRMLHHAKILRDEVRHFKEAEKCYLKCLEIDDMSGGVNSEYALLFYDMGNYEKAIE